MTANTAKTNLLGMSQDMLEQFFAERGEKPFRARQLMQWMHQRYVTDFDEMTDLSKKLREGPGMISRVCCSSRVGATMRP